MPKRRKSSNLLFRTIRIKKGVIQMMSTEATTMSISTISIKDVKSMVGGEGKVHLMY